MPRQRHFGTGTLWSRKHHNKHTIILEPTNPHPGIKLTTTELSAVRQQLETALQESKNTINAIGMRPTNNGNIAIDLENESDKVVAIT